MGETGDVSGTFVNVAVDEDWINVPLTAPGVSTGAGVWITALSTMATGPKLPFCNTNGSAELPGWLLNPISHKTALRRENVATLPATIVPGTATDYIDFLIGVY